MDVERISLEFDEVRRSDKEPGEDTLIQDRWESPVIHPQTKAEVRDAVRED